MKIVTVIGNRPQFVKAAAVSGPLRAEHEEVLVHTGQHYDDELSTIFVTELGVPRPEVAARPRRRHEHRADRAHARRRSASCLREQAPDAVLVYGDTNSTLAGALAAAQLRIPVAHVEAGMRSFDRAMPEELNRVLTDHVADLLLVPSETAAQNLAREGVAGGVELVGDVMVDVAQLVAPRARADDGPLQAAGVRAGEYLLVTAHRAGNVDDPARLLRARRAAARRSRRRSCCRCTRARARACEAAGLLERLAAGDDPAAAARLPRLHLAADARARRADGLRRRAEGGLPRGRAVRDAARHAPSGSRPCRRAGTCSSTSTRDAARAALDRAASRPSGPSSTATAARRERVVAAMARLGAR